MYMSHVSCFTFYVLYLLSPISYSIYIYKYNCVIFLKFTSAASHLSLSKIKEAKIPGKRCQTRPICSKSTWWVRGTSTALTRAFGLSANSCLSHVESHNTCWDLSYWRVICLNTRASKVTSHAFVARRDRVTRMIVRNFAFLPSLVFATGWLYQQLDFQLNWSMIWEAILVITDWYGVQTLCSASLVSVIY